MSPTTNMNLFSCISVCQIQILKTILKTKGEAHRFQHHKEIGENECMKNHV